MATASLQKSWARRWHAPARLLALAATLFLSLGKPALAGNEFRDRSVIGKWKLVSVLDLASIASLDEEDARTLLGKILTISEAAVQVDEETCGSPEFWAERIVPEPHIQEKLHASAERLRLPNPATMIELGCTDVYVRNPNQLVLLWGGVMFDAIRIVAAARHKQPLSGQKKPPAAKRPAAKAEPGKVQGDGRSSPAKARIRTPGYTGRKNTVPVAGSDRRKIRKNRPSK
ncbi:hypothetical protein GJV26_25325 [Massilia dura]|uniref:Uncharacterized protein n=1 Tax=Pseudoduganella dura TaxID=321982 RepID=A0A6I3XPP0_9BURK|nr:hypothetical protein [Pseudoduganella dura]MUI15751.1 hypothetical protein [Pseudoduganella dura]GGX89098.1 hypothetical protein GCM10007386_19890 [Pseudoduganella dura]